jgi:hypothetical protein
MGVTIGKDPDEPPASARCYGTSMRTIPSALLSTMT